MAQGKELQGEDDAGHFVWRVGTLLGVLGKGFVVVPDEAEVTSIAASHSCCQALISCQHTRFYASASSRGNISNTDEPLLPLVQLSPLAAHALPH